MKLAAFDLGSNTLKVTVAEPAAEGGLRVLHEAATITRIGQDLDKNGVLLPEAMDRTEAELERQVEIARNLGATEIACVATAGMRGAANGGAFIERVRQTTGLEIELIDGLREAALAFRAPAEIFGPGPVLVIDPGGRSTELVLGQGSEIRARVSMEIGGVRLTERFLASDPPTADELARSRAHIDRVLAEEAPTIPDDTTLVGVSGTILALLGAQLDQDDMGKVVEQAEHSTLQTQAARAVLADLSTKPAHERLRGTIIPVGRADVIVAGAQIVVGILEHYGADSMATTHRGVRYGLLYEMLARHQAG